MIDNSDQYFNMCDKAEEIQEIFNKNRDKLKEISYIIESGKTIWMPSQEQLQEMVKDDLRRLCQNFFIFVRNHFQPPAMDKFNIQFTSMQQLWFAYMMKKSYNKIWDGIKWIKGT